MILIANVPLVASAMLLARCVLLPGGRSDAPGGHASGILAVAWIALLSYGLSTGGHPLRK